MYLEYRDSGREECLKNIKMRFMDCDGFSVYGIEPNGKLYE